MQFKKHKVTREYGNNYGSQWQDSIELAQDILWIPVELWTVFIKRFSKYFTELKRLLSHMTIQLQEKNNMQESESENQGKLYYNVNVSL